MKQVFQGWTAVASQLRHMADAPDQGEWRFNAGQRASLRALADRLPDNGLILADEVGMGKTRIAVAVCRAVVAAGGRVAVLAPGGLGYQWQDECRKGGIATGDILRSLVQYLAAWNPEAATVEPTWYARDVVLVSHAFTNWKLGGNSAEWRWGLLPEVYARWRKLQTDRLPRNYSAETDPQGKADAEKSGWLDLAAKDICAQVPREQAHHVAVQRLQDLAARTPWPGARDAAEYGRNSLLRPCLENAVGLGLGVFDLVVIDEAHKSRGDNSGLNQLLEQVVLASPSARRLALTATPVELDVEQWKQTLDRIQAPHGKVDAAIETYAAVVRRVRLLPGDEGARQAFIAGASGFRAALSPYLLRRDKREDPFVQQFARQSGRSAHAYREEREISVDTAGLALPWRRAVCAAEALSLVVDNADDPVFKRLRLGMGSGHGIAVLGEGETQDPSGRTVPETGHDETPATADNKRIQRAQWWKDVLSRPFAGSADPLYEHPAILAAVKEIEACCASGEKVLVFGRFTRPLRALQELLNAREMLRALDAGRPWPQSTLGDQEKRALVVAHRQLGHGAALDLAALQEKLQAQYLGIEARREAFRNRMVENIATGLAQGEGNPRARSLFATFRASGESSPSLASALMEMLEGSADPSPADIAAAFCDLVDAASDRELPEAESQTPAGEEPAESAGPQPGARRRGLSAAQQNWSAIEARWQEEYAGPRGGFARLMTGDTLPSTRRLLQLAFNRANSHPKVLVAQSMVGREGLNLHLACRTVVLLHPEWNPGVVEQQIGRVDRIGSLWEKKLQDAVTSGTAPGDTPHIRVWPVVFRGTYDEKNWQVLQERWADLRAQLHGIVIPDAVADGHPQAALLRALNEAAPNFSPLQLEQRAAASGS